MSGDQNLARSGTSTDLQDLADYASLSSLRASLSALGSLTEGNPKDFANALW